MITDTDFTEALARIARTADGEALYLYLQRALMGTLSGEPSPCALRDDHGRRRFASELMAMMAKGIETDGGRADPTASSGRERPIVFAVRQPARTSASRDARAWLRDNDPELKSLVADAPEPDDSGAS